MPITTPFAHNSWIGVLIAAGGGLLTALGINLQKLAIVDKDTNVYKKTVWWCVPACAFSSQMIEE
jgi:hypothetical protein